MIKIGTFGKNPADIILNEKLIELNNDNISHRICRLINKAGEDAIVVNDTSIKYRLLSLLRKEYFEKVNKMDIPEDLKSYTKNIISRKLKFR